MFLGIFSPILFIVLLIIIINLLQIYSSKFLPRRLQTWSWLPRPFRTLAWYDRYVFQNKEDLECRNGNRSQKLSTITNRSIGNHDGHTNKAFINGNDTMVRLCGISTRL